MAEAYIIDACRTPRGIGKQGTDAKKGGALAHMHPQHLAATVLSAIKDRNNLDTNEVDDVIWSTSNQSGQQGHDLGRMAALDAGYDMRASGVTLSRFCGGGISAVNMGAASIMAGVEDCIVAGGMEMMSYVATQRGDGPRLVGGFLSRTPKGDRFRRSRNIQRNSGRPGGHRTARDSGPFSALALLMALALPGLRPMAS